MVQQKLAGEGCWPQLVLVRIGAHLGQRDPLGMICYLFLFYPLTFSSPPTIFCRQQGLRRQPLLPMSQSPFSAPDGVQGHCLTPRECHGFTNPYELVPRALAGTGMGWNFVTPA